LGCEINWERPFGVYLRFTGAVTPADVGAANLSITSDPNFDDLRYTIADFRAATGHRFDLQDRSGLETPYATLIGASYSNPHIHSALIVADPDIERLIQLQITLGVLPYPSRVFTRENDAREWLGSVSGSFRRPSLP